MRRCRCDALRLLAGCHRSIIAAAAAAAAATTAAGSESRRSLSLQQQQAQLVACLLPLLGMEEPSLVAEGEQYVLHDENPTATQPLVAFLGFHALHQNPDDIIAKTG
jgi:hypothetical protein